MAKVKPKSTKRQKMPPVVAWLSSTIPTETVIRRKWRKSTLHSTTRSSSCRVNQPHPSQPRTNEGDEQWPVKSTM